MITVFLLTHIPNPRMNKRIDTAAQCGKVYVVCTRRRSQNVWEPARDDAEHIVFDIDLPSSKHLLRRVLISRKYQHDAFEQLNRINPDTIYAEGLDSLIIANRYKALHKGICIIFEVADLRECFIEQSKTPLSVVRTSLISHKEKTLFKAVDYLVVTSMKFYDLHYRSLIREDRVLFLPNQPNPVSFAGYERKSGGAFTVGFIGGIRYLQQMKMLVDAAQTAHCKVLFAGASISSDDYAQITAYCEDKDFVSFTGRYDYDKDIARLYGMVDCVYAVYDADNPNVRIALPNKLYEAVLCELPVIVAKGTYLAELVGEWGVGAAVSHTDSEELALTLQRLMNDPDYNEKIRTSCREKKSFIDASVYQDKLKAIFQSVQNIREEIKA